jgi:hypothetical protein
VRRHGRVRRCPLGPRLGSAAVVAALVAAGVLASPAPARAADDVATTASTAYELVPSRGILRVTIDLRVTNNVPSGTQWVPCTEWAYDPWIGEHPVQTMCRQTVRYFVNGTYVWLERNARNIRATADRGSVSRSVEKRIERFIAYKLRFEPVHRGQTRKIRVTYEVPGGKPRSATTTRIGRAYANFCVFANGLDGGSVRVLVPKAFETSVWPAAMRSTTTSSRVVFASGAIADTAAFYRCFEGTNEAGFARSELTSASGRELMVEGWPEDRPWRTAVAKEVRISIDGLERLVGRSLPGDGTITVREVSDSELGDYAGMFDPATGVARISETYTEPGVVAHELAHAWFNLDTLAARWMSEGLAQWAERVSPTA